MLQKIALERLLNVTVQERTLCDQGINSLLGDLPGDSVDQQGILDCVELTEHWVCLVFFSVKDVHVDIDQLVHLEDGEDVEVLMYEEDLTLVVHGGVSDAENHKLHDFLADVCRGKVSEIDLHGNLERVISDTDAEQIYELSMSDL